MHAYAIQDSAGLVKLDAMENPFRLPEALQRELGERLGAVAINRYPARCVGDVIAALREYVDLPAGCKLMLGNGSDELIALLALACDIPGATILAPLPGFVMYEMSARLQGLKFVGVPLTATSSSTPRRCWRRSPAHRPALTYIAYPNNPTAQPVRRGRGRAHRRRRRRAGRAGRLRRGLPAVLVALVDGQGRDRCRTCSSCARSASSAWPASASATSPAPAALIDEVDKVRPPYNISALNAEATLFALEHAGEFARQAALLRGERERLQKELAAMPGVTAFPSEANMILVRVPDAAKVFEGMKSRGVLVKNVDGLHPLLADCLRLTVGTAEENTLMIDALRASLR